MLLMGVIAFYFFKRGDLKKVWEAFKLLNKSQYHFKIVELPMAFMNKEILNMKIKLRYFL